MAMTPAAYHAMYEPSRRKGSRSWVTMPGGDKLLLQQGGVQSCRISIIRFAEGSGDDPLHSSLVIVWRSACKCVYVGTLGSSCLVSSSAAPLKMARHHTDA